MKLGKRILQAEGIKVKLGRKEKIKDQIYEDYEDFPIIKDKKSGKDSFLRLHIVFAVCVSKNFLILNQASVEEAL